MRNFMHEGFAIMPNAVALQQARRRAIAQLLKRNTIVRQTELVQLLRSDGYHATQSSVSRDLKDMGAAKLNSGYSLPERLNADNEQQLTGVAEFIRDVRPAGPNMLVITTAIGAAQRVALTLDRISWPEIVGTLSGDDTIFIATTGAAQLRRLTSRLRQSWRKTTS
jgi:transcriptional regulator of arginine metabolism